MFCELSFSVFFFGGNSLLLSQNTLFLGSFLLCDTLFFCCFFCRDSPLFGDFLFCNTFFFCGLFFCDALLLGSFLGCNALLFPPFFLGCFFFCNTLLLNPVFFHNATHLSGDALLLQSILLFFIVGISSDTNPGQHQNGNHCKYIGASLFPDCAMLFGRLFSLLNLSLPDLFGFSLAFEPNPLGLVLLLFVPDAPTFGLLLFACVDQLLGI